jgi:predicted DsbA family dithiol-disulfide isomerase
VAVAEKRLVVFADYTCPWCYLAESVLDRLRGDGVAVEAAAFELRPAGTPLPGLDEEWMLRSWREAVEPLAGELGAEIRYPALATRTRKAHEAAAFARSRGVLAEMHRAIYRAFWVEGRDIGRIDVLCDLGAAAGLDPSELRVALDIDQWTDRVAQDLALAGRLPMNGVPAYLLMELDADGNAARADLRTGLQRYDELKGWVTE